MESKYNRKSSNSTLLKSEEICENEYGSLKSTPNKQTYKKSLTESLGIGEMKQSSEFYLTWVRPLLGEFLGMLFFTFIHCSTSYSLQSSDELRGNALLPALSDGLVLTVVCIVLGHISGAHVNFAVTVAVCIGGKIELVKTPFYLIAQLLGSISGAGLSYVANGHATGAFQLGENINVGQGVLMEMVLTSFLCLSVLLAAVQLESLNAAFAIGFSVLIGILAGFKVSGGCMNPTISFGPALLSQQWNDYWVYWIGPVSGAIIAGILFRLYLADEQRLLFRPNFPSSPDDAKMENGKRTEKP